MKYSNIVPKGKIVIDVIFTNSKFTKEAAKNWLTEHGYSSNHIKDGAYVFTASQNEVKRGKKETVRLQKGITAIVTNDPEFFEHGGNITQKYAIGDDVEFDYHYGKSKETKRGEITGKTKRGEFIVTSGTSQIEVKESDIIKKIPRSEPRKKVFGIFKDGGNIEIDRVNKEIEDIQKAIRKNEEDMERHQQIIEKIRGMIGELHHNLSEISKNSSDESMPWQKSMSPEEIEFIISSINRYGHGQHPKSTKGNWRLFSFAYIQDVLKKIPEQSHLTQDGQSTMRSVMNKMNVKV